MRPLLLSLLLSSVLSAEGSSSGSGPSLKVTEGSFTAAQMPEQSDRAQKSKVAAAAAKAGAAMQQVNCIRMQADAAAEKDEDTKYFKQIAAAMQCQQAQQSQQNAEENEENAKTLSTADIPKPASFKAGSVSIAGSINESERETDSLPLGSRLGSGSDSPDSEAAPPSTERSLAENQSGGPAEPSERTKENNSSPTVPESIPKTGLPVTQGDSIVFDESRSNPNGLGIMGGWNSLNGPSRDGMDSKPEKLRTLSDEVASEIAQLERGIRSFNGGEASGSDSAETPTKNSGLLDALMAQLNSETPSGALGGVPLQEIVSVPVTDGAPRFHIFEFASYRYQLAAKEQLKPAPRRLPMRSTASLSGPDPKKPAAPLRRPAPVGPTDLLSASRSSAQ